LRLHLPERVELREDRDSGRDDGMRRAERGGNAAGGNGNRGTPMLITLCRAPNFTRGF
jgi:hypothetical protein